MKSIPTVPPMQTKPDGLPASIPAIRWYWHDAPATGLRRLLLLIVAISLFPALVLNTVSSEAQLVGVVDHKLVSQENWVKPWKADWDSSQVVSLLDSHGIQAEVIGLDALKSLERLKTYRAILIPTDECYPDEGRPDGPISKNLAAYVNTGGIYIMPMGASHCRWKDTLTGVIAETPRSTPTDFLGVQWRIVGDHASAGPVLSLTPEGERIGIPKPVLQGNSTYARAAVPTGIVYVSNAAQQPCLYANAVGSGAVVHYAGGLPLGPEVRNWLMVAYAAILKSGPDIKAIRLATIKNLRVYDLVPVSPRAQGELSLDGDWELAQAKGDAFNDTGEIRGLDWIGVKMPNTIQHALFLAGKAANPWYADNYKQLQWIHGQDWYLRKRFTIPADWSGRHIRLRFDGLDYIGLVWLDGTFLGSHEGMFGGPTFDVSRQMSPGSHELLVRLVHETGPQGGPTQVIKSMAIDGTSYQWGNRYRTIGLWRSVRLVSSGDAYLEAPYVRTESLQEGKALLHAQAVIHNTGTSGDGTIKARIIDPQTGQVVWQRDTVQLVPPGNSFWEQPIEIEKPKRWWPNGIGEGIQPLYRLELALLQGSKQMDLISTRFGIRTLEMVRNPSWPKSPRTKGSSWGDAGSFDWQVMLNPDESYRFLFVVNGIPMYGKGACWLTSDDLLALTPERESWLIRAAKLAGFNLFRLNGGCNLFETEQFYNLCDEQGILVWQELPFCWNTTAGATTPVWRDQLTQSVLRLRQHPSLAVYCGGNEFNPYAQGVAPVVDLFREICAAYDNRPFRMSSPGGGTAHAYGPWEIYNADPNWYGSLYDEGYNFVSEWSYPSCASLSLLERIVPQNELAGKPVGLDWEAFVRGHPILADRSSELAFIGRFPFIKGSCYADYSKADLKEYIECTQMAQADVYGTVFEQWRSQFPYKGGETVWLYNTIGPVSSWNLIDWFGQPQLSYYTTKRANEPVHVMAKSASRSWGAGDTFRASIMVLSDDKSSDTPRLTARILDRHMKPVATQPCQFTLHEGGKSMPAGNDELTWPIPNDTPPGYFFLELTLTDRDGKRLSRQVYWERVLQSLADPEMRKKWLAGPVPEEMCVQGPWLKTQVASCPTTLSGRMTSTQADRSEARLTAVIKNTGANPAYPVNFSVSPATCAVVWSDNWFWLAPGESATVTGTVRLDMKGIDPMSKVTRVDLKDVKVTVEAWNVPGQEIATQN